MVIVCDIDGVIALEREDRCYPLCELNVEARDALNLLTQKGHLIILHTSRWETDYLDTWQWLYDNKVPYDSLVMGKPRGDIYIDDKGFKFVSWEETLKVLEKEDASNVKEG